MRFFSHCIWLPIQSLRLAKASTEFLHSRSRVFRRSVTMLQQELQLNGSDSSARQVSTVVPSKRKLSTNSSVSIAQYKSIFASPSLSLPTPPASRNSTCAITQHGCDTLREPSEAAMHVGVGNEYSQATLCPEESPKASSERKRLIQGSSASK